MSDWFRDSVVYQIYTRSFKDSNRDGIGDFGGVIEKLDYLKDLGVDVLWLSPFCDSPNDDNGYDISDYLTVIPEFGTLDDFDALVRGAHSRGMKIMMDLVMNHTSDEHPWFLESRSSRNNPKRDWYIWAQPSQGPGEGFDEIDFDQAGRGYAGRARGPRLSGVDTGFLPNNWDSYFGGKAWEFDPQTGEYYCHIFSKKQPDLNWANPEVREEMFRIAHWWIDRGVDAFRLDAVHHIGKPEDWPDAPVPKEPWGFCLYKNTPETHTYLQEMNRRVFRPRAVLTVGETGGTTPESARLYVDSDRNELDMIFHFAHVHMENPNDASALTGLMSQWYAALKPRAWDAQFFSNHDLPRQVSSFGDDRWLRGKSAKAIAALLLTSWGTPFLYQGEEIGLPNAYFPDIRDYRDIHALRGYREGLASGEDPELVMAVFQTRNRDNSRTPMQWSGEANAGFCEADVQPWIPVPRQNRHITVEAELAGRVEYAPGGSIGGAGILSWYRDLIALRRRYSVLRRGAYAPVNPSHSRVICYLRYLEDPAFAGDPARSKEPEHSSPDQSEDQSRAGEKTLALVIINWTGTQADYHLSPQLLSQAEYLDTPPETVKNGSLSAFSLEAGNYAVPGTLGSAEESLGGLCPDESGAIQGGTTGAADFAAALGGDSGEFDSDDDLPESGRPVLGAAPVKKMRLRPWECRVYLG